MDDDFNSAGAIGSMFELIRTYNKLVDEKGVAILSDRDTLKAVRDTITVFDTVLGIFPDGFPAAGDDVPPDVLDVVEARQQARKDKDFAKADQLRDRIAAMGFTLEDTPQGARVRKK